MRIEALARNAWYAKAPSALAAFVSRLLAPVSFLYALIMRIRRRRYRTSPGRSVRLAIPVISAGNVTVGGSGKTPTAILLAMMVRDLGRKPVILSRGYKGALEGKVAVVSDGARILLTSVQAGDEPVMMARKNPDIPVVIGASRVDAAKRAREQLGADCLILDDGFQHMALARDLNILCINAELGVGNGQVFPSGPLREPLAASRDADLCLINGYGKERPKLEADLRSAGFAGSFVRVTYTICRFASLDQKIQMDPGELRGKKVLAFSALAHPSPFFNSLESFGLSVVEQRTYPDHYPYPIQQLDRLAQLAKVKGIEYYVTTEKDAVKLAESDYDFQAPVLAAVLMPLLENGDRQRLVDALKGVM